MTKKTESNERQDDINQVYQSPYHCDVCGSNEDVTHECLTENMKSPLNIQCATCLSIATFTKEEFRKRCIQLTLDRNKEAETPKKMKTKSLVKTISPTDEFNYKCECGEETNFTRADLLRILNADGVRKTCQCKRVLDLKALYESK